MIAKSTIERVKDLDVKDVLESYGIGLNRAGAQYKCCCPLHGEKTPSFSVHPGRNIWKCFGCGEGGSAVDFVMKYEGLTFSEAVESIAKRHGIPVEYTKIERTEAEKAEERRKDEMRTVVALIQKFFVDQFNKDTAEAAAARDYAYGRWSKEFCAEAGIGLAPKDSWEFLAFIKSNRIAETARELGYVGVNVEKDTEYAQFRNRLTIPINDSWGRPIAFTARDLSGQSPAKYINSKTSPIYKKESVLFGIEMASRKARVTDNVIVVEGAPDVLRLQSIGLTQTVAPLGTALTVQQLEKLKPLCRELRFIPDSDPPKGKLYGTGVATVMKNGRLAMEQGFAVSVREIPRTDKDDEEGIKHDPDSYVTSIGAYSDLEDVPFVVWYARKRFAGADTQSLQREVVQEVAELLAMIDDSLTREMTMDLLCRIHGKKKLWSDAVKQRMRSLRKSENEGIEAPAGMDPKIFESLRRCGFIVKNGCYHAADEENGLVRCTNFTFEPVLHIKNKLNSARIFRMTNNRGETEVVEFQSKDMVTVRDFNRKLFDRGNYAWRGDAEQFTAIQEHLLEVTPSANLIDILGWNPIEGFYAFSNGIYKDGEFTPVDKLGVVRSVSRNYYLPAFSEIHADNELGFSFERLYTCNPKGGTTLRDFVAQIVKVYGTGGMVSFAWTLAAVFRDIIFSEFKWFPVLNLFGRKGSGKTELARALSSLFYTLPSSPLSLSNSSIPVIGYNLSHARNSMIILDEFTNDLMPIRIDLLKNLWGGTARSKMEDGVPLNVPVTSGVIIAGQYKPEDEAIFSRCIHLMYSKTAFSYEEDREFNLLRDMVKLGNTHLLLEILNLRKIFKAGFFQAYDLALRDVIAKLPEGRIETRVRNNWVVCLAAFRVLESHIDVPFTYAELFDAVIGGIKYQNEQITKASDTANFWLYLDSMHTQGKVKEKCHFIIKKMASFKARGKETRQFLSPKKVIFLNYKAVRALLEQRIAKQRSGNTLDTSTLESYLKSLPQFLGIKQQRFQIMKTNGELETEYSNEMGTNKRFIVANPANALCFDYDALRDMLDLNLGTFRMTEDEMNATDEDETEDTVEASQKEPTSPAPMEDSEPDLFTPIADTPF